MLKQAPIFCSSRSNRLPFSFRHVQTMSSAIGLLVMLKQAPICFVMFKQAPIFCSSCSNRLPFSVRHVQTVQTGLCSCCRLRRTSRLSGCGPARTRRSPSSTRTWTSCPQTRCSFLSSVSPAGCEQCSVNNALMRDFGLSTRLSCGTLACPQDCHAGLWPVHKTVMQDFGLSTRLSCRIFLPCRAQI